MEVVKPLKKIKWTHRIIDGFFDHRQLYVIDELFQYGFQSLEDWRLYSDGKLKPVKDWKSPDGKQFTGFAAFIPFTGTERWAEHIQYVIANSPDRGWEDLKRQDYFSFMELNIVGPGHEYIWHIDAEHKAVSITTYIGERGDGTILRSGYNEEQVEWKHNRGLIFCSSSTNSDGNPTDRPMDDELMTWHKFRNTTSDLRCTVNINFMKPEFTEQYFQSHERLKNFNAWTKPWSSEMWGPTILPPDVDIKEYLDNLDKFTSLK
tara:strand:+ start:935 stop:1720 length:786 start_codon:yes stop_codon:yes gene_type:complete